MAAPGNALTAEFRAVTCSLDVSTRVTEYQFVEDKPKGHPRKSQKKKKKKKKKQTFTLERDDEEDYCNLGLDDRMAIDRFMSSFDGLREGSPKSAVGFKRKRVATVKPVTDITSARGLFEAAVEILLFGGTRRCIGFKVLEGESLPGLVHLAPGVFHIPYLTVSGPMPPFSLTISSRLRSFTGSVEACWACPDHCDITGTNGKRGVAEFEKEGRGIQVGYGGPGQRR